MCLQAPALGDLPAGLGLFYPALWSCCICSRIGMRPTVSERFWANVTKTEGCWEWVGIRSRDGYGRFFAKGRRVQAHRWVYEDQVGPIPEGQVLDHLCRNTSCVRPDHLEPVTQTENMRRGYWASRTHCGHGHEFTEENTHMRADGQGRKCRTCIRENSRRSAARRRARLRAASTDTTDKGPA